MKKLLLLCLCVLTARVLCKLPILIWQAEKVVSSRGTDNTRKMQMKQLKDWWDNSPSFIEEDYDHLKAIYEQWSEEGKFSSDDLGYVAGVVDEYLRLKPKSGTGGAAAAVVASSVAQLQSNLDTLKARLASRQLQLSKRISDVSRKNIETEIANLKKEIADLEAKLHQAKQ